MRTILLILITSVLSAEQVTIAFRPNGSSCRHIHIRGEDGRNIYVTTESDVANSDSETDAYILRQLKKAVRASGCALNDRPCLRTFIEAQDFDTKDLSR